MTVMEQQNFSPTRQIVTAALGIALVFAFTSFVNVRLPIAANGGLIHLGNVPLFIIAILSGRRLGALAGGLGMALFDVVGGWLLWAPFTLVIVGLMGYSVGAICENRRSLAANHGMVFVFAQTQPVCMWMKNTLVPLSVAFITAQGRIVNIADMQPQTEDVHCAQTEVRYALEAPLHWFAQRGIRPGMSVLGLSAAGR